MIPAPFFVTHSKLERAQELIRQLARHIAESSVGHLPFPEPIAHMSKDNVALGHVWVVHTAPVPESLPYMVSEIAYNLRGVLDSIIDEILPSKVSLGRRKLGFPFEKNESALNDRLLNSLAGVDEREKALIRALKPYFEDGNSTLCGLDKLATVGRRNVIQLAVSVIPANCFALSDEGGIGVDRLERGHDDVVAHLQDGRVAAGVADDALAAGAGQRDGVAHQRGPEHRPVRAGGTAGDEEDRRREAG